MLAATAIRSDRLKPQLFIDPRTEAVSQLSAQMLPFGIAQRGALGENDLSPFIL